MQTASKPNERKTPDRVTTCVSAVSVASARRKEKRHEKHTSGNVRRTEQRSYDLLRKEKMMKYFETRPGIHAPPWLLGRLCPVTSTVKTFRQLACFITSRTRHSSRKARLSGLCSEPLLNCLLGLSPDMHGVPAFANRFLSLARNRKSLALRALQAHFHIGTQSLTRSTPDYGVTENGFGA